MKLSHTQEEALKMMKEKGGGVLVRWPGGFWTFSGAQGRAVYNRHGYLEYLVPEWWCGVRTVRALAKKGVVDMKLDARGYEIAAVLKDEI